jgi:IS30 family transposase
MTKHVMTSADRTKIIEALKKKPNAAVVAKQFGFGETTILRLCKKEGIGLQHLLTKAERTEVIELLKTNLNALATAKQLGVNHKTVLAVAKKEGIDIKGQ